MVGLILTCALALGAQQPEPPTTLTHGPFVGGLRPTGVTLWARASSERRLGCRVSSGDEAASRNHGTRSHARDDFCLEFRFDDLRPNRSYDYTISDDELVLARGTFRTPPPDDQPSRAILAFGSCVDERRFPEQPAWNVMADRGAEAVVLLGDTPYIDSTDLLVQRQRYREFYAIEPLARLLARVPLYATWDDHDFGRNDTNGKLKGRELARQAFIEYHPGSEYGGNGEGIYSRFRRGPVDVFLLDTRWFAGTEDSHVAKGTPTLLGHPQWVWLTSRLLNSDAPFKLLASGMIWNGATRPNKPDHWESYAAERDALFGFISRYEITGVVLIGGDIHRSRVVVHDTAATVGYPLTELITSPIANRVIEAANAPHPGLRWDAGLPDTFMLVEADSTVEPATLTARFLDSKGEEHHRVELTSDALRPR